jgi:hypothetical protein
MTSAESPTKKVSPNCSGRGSAPFNRRFPMKVPLALPRSLSANVGPISMAACEREQAESSMAIVQSWERPSVTMPAGGSK